MSQISKLIIVIFLINIVYSQLFLCNFDEECPTNYLCYENSCQLIYYFTACTSSCTPGCCVKNYCRSNNQKICSYSNSCQTYADCPGGCCSNNKCNFPSLCGILPPNSNCTDNSMCKSSCCYNSKCLSADNNLCKTNDLENILSKDTIFAIILGIANLILLAIIIILICIFRNRLIIIKSYEAELEALDLLILDQSRREFIELKSSNKSLKDLDKMKDQRMSKIKNIDNMFGYNNYKMKNNNYIPDGMKTSSDFSSIKQASFDVDTRPALNSIAVKRQEAHAPLPNTVENPDSLIVKQTSPRSLSQTESKSSNITGFK